MWRFLDWLSGSWMRKVGVGIVATACALIIALVVSECQGREVQRGLTTIQDRQTIKADQLVRLGSDRIRVYHVVSADGATARLRHIPRHEDLEAAGCGERHIRQVTPHQNIVQAEEYSPGEFQAVYQGCKM